MNKSLKNNFFFVVLIIVAICLSSDSYSQKSNYVQARVYVTAESTSELLSDHNSGLRIFGTT